MASRVLVLNELKMEIAPVVETITLALNRMKAYSVPVIVGDSTKVLLNDHISTFDNVHLVSLFSPNIVSPEVVCVNNNTDSPLLTPYNVNTLENLDSDGEKMDKTALNSDSYCTQLITYAPDLIMLSEGFDVVDKIVASNFNPLLNSDLPI